MTCHEQGRGGFVKHKHRSGAPGNELAAPCWSSCLGWFSAARGGSEMKLAEALLLRADRKRTLEQLKARAQATARFQEGEEPAEDAIELLARAEDVLTELERLIRQVNKTNSVTALPDGRTVTAALAERDVLRLRYALLTGVADAGSGQAGGQQGRMPPVGVRQMRSELKFIAAVPVAALRQQANDVARQHRELDAQIQQVNWTVDLIEN